MTAAVEVDRRAIETLGGALRSGARCLAIVSPMMAITPERVAVETDATAPNAVGGLRTSSEKAALELVARGVRGTIVRLLPSMLDETTQGLVTELIAIARKKGSPPLLVAGRTGGAPSID